MTDSLTKRDQPDRTSTWTSRRNNFRRLSIKSEIQPPLSARSY